MALKACRECGEQISATANPCPRCGRQWPHGASAIVKYGGGFIALSGALVVALGFAATSKPATSPRSLPAHATSAASIAPPDPPEPPAPAAVLVKDVVGSIERWSGGQRCKRMAKEPQSCRFMISDSFTFMVKITAVTSPIVPDAEVEQVLAMFPQRLPDAQTSAAASIMLNMAKVAHLPDDNGDFFGKVAVPGEHAFAAQNGGTSALSVKSGAGVVMATVTRPKGAATQ